ncbi:MAG: nucleotide exchange factor GrpE [Oscillospiraceae bacterium]|nr:nucleotide exchange factor GrpE [Oscillospiraceae bacterium]
MTDELRDADGCEDFESLEESGLHDEEPDTADTPGTPEADEENVNPEAENAEDTAADAEEPELEELDPAEQKLIEANDKYMRLFAEFDNFRKRTAKEKSETYQDAVAKTLLALLPAVDSFERAMEVPCTDEAYRSGMEKIYAQMTDLLKKLGLEEIPALNEPFDPKVHNAIRQVEDGNFGESTVCEVYQKGYRLGDRIVRCAMVSVAN